MLRLPRFRSTLIVVPVLALLAGAALLVYSRWSQPLIEAEAASKARDPKRALGAYAVSAARFNQLATTRQMFPDEFARLTHNQLALLYQAGEYDKVIEMAEAAPPEAAPRFWVACSLFAKGRLQAKPEVRLEWLTRAEDEFKLALAAAPDDWDTKYNYELTARLTAAMRKQPKAAPPDIMQLLKPQPTGQQNKEVKKTG